MRANEKGTGMDVKEVISSFEKELACGESDERECAITDCRNCEYYVRPSKMEEVYKAAVEALKKADPQKPETEEDEYGCSIRYSCPTCGTYFGTRGRNTTILFHRPKYCDCGQAIDWTE